MNYLTEVRLRHACCDQEYYTENILLREKEMVCMSCGEVGLYSNRLNLWTKNVIKHSGSITPRIAVRFKVET